MFFIIHEKPLGRLFPKFTQDAPSTVPMEILPIKKDGENRFKFNHPFPELLYMVPIYD